MRKTSLSYIVITAALWLMLGACTGISPQSKKSMDEESLRERVTLEWESRKTNSWAAVYDLTTAEYRKGHSRELFGANSNTTTESYIIKTLAINAEKKEAAVTVEQTIRHMGFKFPFPSNELWVWENNNWYLQPKR